VPGVAAVDGPEQRSLDAVYFDTDDLALARIGVALRRRTGGPDEGWHVKTSAPEGRHEYGWPLEVEVPTEVVHAETVPTEVVPAEIVVPADVRAAVAAWIGDAVLAPIARVRNRRAAYALRNADGALIAEFTDDRVVATDLVREVETAWREWEAELGPAAPPDARGRTAFFDAVIEAVRAVGGRPAASESKLQRALGR